MTAPPAQPEPDLTGTVLADRYRVTAKLGAGGMGTVYLAEHTTIHKKFAIKVLASKLMERADLVERFMREARATSMIQQKNVVEISDFGETPHGSVFFAMEYLEGEDLRMMIRREKRVPWERVRHFAVQICRALDAAHAAGIIHRDMKPDNCFRMTKEGDEDFIKVLDFGIAKLQDDGGKGLTKTGMIFGTAQYMSPEQAQALPVDARVDVYAVGVILYELLCGRTPFRGKNFGEILAQHLYEAPRPPGHWAPDAGIPEEAEAIVLKALLKDPNLRFQSMSEMIAALEAVGTGAEAVEVANEQLVRPDMSAAMTFKGSSASMAAVETRPSTSSAGMSVTQPTQRRSDGLLGNKRLLVLGVGGLTLAGLLGVVAIVASGGKDTKDPATEPAAPPAPAPAPAPTPAPTPEVTTCTVSITTNVEAAVLDAADRGRWGFTNQEGIQFPVSEEPIKLILVAEGYAELEVEIIPNRAKKMFEYTLKVDAESEGDDDGKPKKGSKSPKKDDKTKSTDEAELPKSSDIKNPFD